MPSKWANLVDAEDLVVWANRRDSQSVLPQLVRRLVLGSAKGLRRVTFRSGSGVQLPGTDGVTVADDAHPFVPAGVTAWELTTIVVKDLKTKADEDYGKRGAPEFAPEDSTFAFVSLRRWPNKHAWVDARKADGVWREVVALDADDLETWIEACPAVHVWLSRQLGRDTEDAEDVESYFRDWSNVTGIPLTAAFLSAGRQAAVESIQARLQTTESFAVRAESADEAMAVLAVAVLALPEEEREALLTQTVIVRTRAALDRFAYSESPLIMIPLFEDQTAAGRALGRGHRVIVPVGKTASDTASTIDVPRLATGPAAEALQGAGSSKEASAELAVLGRRSLMALRRKLSVRPELQQAPWARPENARSVLPLLLAGGWNESSEGDRQIVAEIAQADAARVQELAVRWSRDADPVVRSVGSVWYVPSSEDAWRQLAGAITVKDLERFEQAVLTVLGGTDPRWDIDPDSRWLSLERRTHSGSLQNGLAETLAVMGSLGSTTFVAGTPVEAWAHRIVRALLDRANGDWRIWASLSSQLPLLAEAAPDAFLDAVEKGLTGEKPILKLFQEPKDVMLGSSPHTGLLFALERLSWARDYLALASLALAKLTRVDPGGRLANRPRRSLRETFLPWVPQTVATWDEQFEVLGMLLDRVPDVGWQLHSDLLPKDHDSSSDRKKPQWRDWAPNDDVRVTIAENLRRVRDIAGRMLDKADHDGMRWRDLVTALPNLPRDPHDTIVERLEVINTGRLSEEGRDAVWTRLREIVGQHRSFPDAKWALPAAPLERLAKLLDRFEARYGWLFADRVTLPEGREGDWEDRDRAVAEARRDAVSAIHAAGGTAAICALIPSVKNASQLGGALSASGVAQADEDKLLHDHVGSPDPALSAFGRGFVVGGVQRNGTQWLYDKVKKEEFTPLQRAEMLSCLPSDPEVWAVAEADPALETCYWKRARSYYKGSPEDVEHAVRKLMEFGRAHAAVEELDFRLRDEQPPSSTLIVEALEKVLGQPDIDFNDGDFSYRVGELLNAVTRRRDVEEARVARLEWAFAPLLRLERPPALLHREILRNPTFFAELLAILFKPEAGEDRESTDEAANLATRAFHVTESIRRMPGVGEEGSIDVAALNAWVDAALKATIENGRPTLGAQYVGRLLSYSPPGADGAQPHEAVRDVIERHENPEVERGFHLGVFNSRGVTTRSLEDGGRQEHELADRCVAWATQLNTRWPRTAAMLRQMSEDYRRQARREDAETDRRKDGLW
jgi:hypothetical protein